MSNGDRPSHLREVRTPSGRVVWTNRNTRARGREGGRIRWFYIFDPMTRRRIAEGSCLRDLLASIDRHDSFDRRREEERKP